jgi:hypothetical protein
LAVVDFSEGNWEITIDGDSMLSKILLNLVQVSIKKRVIRRISAAKSHSDLWTSGGGGCGINKNLSWVFL